MRNIKFFIPCILALAWAMPASAWHGHGGSVSVEVVGDYGRALQRFPVAGEHDSRVTRAYLEATPGEQYALRVRNNTPERVGVVIAVDGRNIISGKKSKLKRGEKMYVLGPYQGATYKGWRTGRNRVNEFYFTSEIDSYAGAFGDYSAMGVIAVAAFRDRSWQPPRHSYRRDHAPREEGHGPYDGHSSKNRPAPNARSHSGDSLEAAPGTGFGDERWSPSVRVEFDAERKAFHRVFLKYEWRDTLCEMGIARCHVKRHNRFWRDDRYVSRRGYAPYPPGYRRWHRDDYVNYRRYR